MIARNGEIRYGELESWWGRGDGETYGAMQGQGNWVLGE